MKRKKTWKEKIILVAASGRNSSGRPLWYSPKKITEKLSEYEDRDLTRAQYKNIVTPLLLQLTKSGHLERMRKPKELMCKPPELQTGPEYLYRWTGKRFVAGRGGIRPKGTEPTHGPNLGELSHAIYVEYPKLPKWFRKMMY